MENYIEADLPGMTCKVLRVFKKNEAGTSNLPSTASPVTLLLLLLLLLLQKPKHQNKKNLNTAFEDLDHESLLFQDTPTLCDTTSSLNI